MTLLAAAVVAIRSLVVVVLLVSLSGKARGGGWRAFVASTARLAPVGRRSAAARVGAGVVALAMSALLAEVLVVVLLLVTATASVGLASGVVLFGAYAGLLRRSVRRGDRAPCACFGVSAVPVGGLHVGRAAALAVAAAAGLVLIRTTEAPLSLPATGLAVAAGLVAALPLVLLDDLVDLFGRGPVPS